VSEELTFQTQVERWQGQIKELAAKADTLPDVVDDTTACDNADVAKEAHVLLKQVEEARKTSTQPLVDAKRQVDDAARRLKNLLEPIKKRLSAKVTAWQVEQERKARAEAERIRREQAAAEAAALAAAEQGDDASFEIEASKTETLEAEARATAKAAPKTTGTSFGRVTLTTRVVPEIVDEAKIPRQYLQVDMVKIRAAAKADPRPDIPGVKWVEERGSRVL